MSAQTIPHKQARPQNPCGTYAYALPLDGIASPAVSARSIAGVWATAPDDVREALNAYHNEKTASAAARVALRVACYTRAAAVVTPGDDMLAGALASQGIRPLTCSVRGGKAHYAIAPLRWIAYHSDVTRASELFGAMSAQNPPRFGRAF